MTNGQHNENRRKALKEKAAKDYYRLTYHVMPEGGWMNDPNGLIQFRGQYHVFFQHYPYATSWGPMHWGHVVGEQGTMWECPDLFHLDGADILMCSPINMKGTRTMFLTGKMDYKGYHFTPKCCDKVDYGPEFYAPQTFLDSRGRRILIGWMATWGEKIPTGKNGWAGALTLPRELFLEDGRVCQRPVREISSLRRETLHQGSIQLKDDQHGNLSSVASDCMEIKISARENSARRKTCGRLDFILRASADFGECTVVSYDFERQELTVDTRNSGQGRKGRTVVKVPLKEGSLKIQMFVDRSSLEIFCGGGRYVISTRIFPQENSLYCDLVSKGSDITVESLEIYRL